MKTSLTALRHSRTYIRQQIQRMLSPRFHVDKERGYAAESALHAGFTGEPLTSIPEDPTYGYSIKSRVAIRIVG